MGVWLPERAISLAIWQWLHLKAHANLQAPLGPIHMFLWWTTKPHTSPGLSYLSHSASSQAVLLHRPPCPVIPLITHRIFPCPTSSIWPWSVYFFFTRLVQRCLWLFSLYYLQQKPDPWLWSGHFGASLLCLPFHLVPKYRRGPWTSIPKELVPPYRTKQLIWPFKRMDHLCLLASDIHHIWLQILESSPPLLNSPFLLTECHSGSCLLFLSSWSLLQNRTGTAAASIWPIWAPTTWKGIPFYSASWDLLLILLPSPCLCSYIIRILLLQSSYLRPPFLKLPHLLALLLALSSSDLSLIPLTGSSLSPPPCLLELEVITGSSELINSSHLPPLISSFLGSGGQSHRFRANNLAQTR